MKNKRDIRGQTALILILLTAAALIFLAITLNWGRIAQTKTLLTIAADQAGSLLASDVASYGEMEKQTYLGNSNEKKGLDGILIAIVAVIIAVVIAFFTWGAGLTLLSVLGNVLLVVSVVAAVANLALQLAVVQPEITRLWNNLQKNQPITQQFFEGGVSTALEGTIGDQTNITDYFDLNTNGQFGTNASGFPNDTVGRFAFFYTERLKMLNQPASPQVALFDNQLGELLNGETCDQNASDNNLDPGISINPACASLDCFHNPTDPACEVKIPGGFQLNDACLSNSDSTSSTYNPYCDPCCQPLSVPDPNYNTSNPFHSSPNISVRPSSCTDQSTVPAQCFKNNPYNSTPIANDSPYPLLYDPTYQNYASGISFLDQFGRDQPMGPFSATLTSQGNFPNGVYPFFWLMKNYSPEVDKINLSTNAPIAGSPDLHWCAATNGSNGIVIPAFVAPTGFSDLAQLNLANSSGYTCAGGDCCVNYLADSLVNMGGVPTPAWDVTAGSTINGPIDMVGSQAFPYQTSPTNLYNPAIDPSFAEPVSNATNWLEGDNQMCLATWPYNGKSTVFPDGTCEWTNGATPPSSYTPPVTRANPSPASSLLLDPAISTVDSLDDTMHTFSDFLNFSTTLLKTDVGTLNSTFNTWYPQAAQWIAPACDMTCTSPTCQSPACTEADFDNGLCKAPDNFCNAGSNGRLLNIYDPSGYPNVGGISNGAPVDKLSDWNTVITNWLKNVYVPVASPFPWCVPLQNDPSLYDVNGKPTQEEQYIANSTNSGTGPWGDLGHIISCLNYNGNVNSAPAMSSVAAYNACLSIVTSSTCPAAVPLQCAPATLGRTLLNPVKERNPGYGCNAQYKQWLTDSLALATDEAPKFALRSQFLSDIYNRAKTMQNIFTQGDIALHSFLKPCGTSPNCADGGPAAQLIYLRSAGQPAATLPNSVIYGWVDKNKANGQVPGYAHIVKVTAYSPGRNGGVFGAAQLPWINTSSGLIYRTYILTDRDGAVYASVKRWDEDHGNALAFPNGHPLWQFLFHNPKSFTNTSGSGLPASCIASNPGQALGKILTAPIGFGLTAQTAAGLAQALSQSQQDTQTLDAFQKAFMLNDEGDGTVDRSIAGGNSQTCAQGNTSSYCKCLSAANKLLDTAPESHACVEYIASRNASGSSNSGDSDYSLKFISCNPVPPDDLTYEEKS